MLVLGLSAPLAISHGSVLLSVPSIVIPRSKTSVTNHGSFPSGAGPDLCPQWAVRDVDPQLSVVELGCHADNSGPRFSVVSPVSWLWGDNPRSRSSVDSPWVWMSRVQPWVKVIGQSLVISPSTSFLLESAAEYSDSFFSFFFFLPMYKKQVKVTANFAYKVQFTCRK